MKSRRATGSGIDALQDDALVFHREWISASEASAILGRHHDHLTRLCRTKLQSSGRAKLFKPPSAPDEKNNSVAYGKTTGGTGGERWFLHRSFDQRLATGYLGTQACVALARFEAASAQLRQMAWQRQACVEAFLESWRGGKRRVDQFLPGLLECLTSAYPDLIKGTRSKTITRSTLYRWRSDLSKPGGVANLIYERGGHRKGNGSLEAWVHFESLYCTSHQPKNVYFKQYGRMREVHVNVDPQDVMSLIGLDCDLVDFVEVEPRTTTPGEVFQDLTTRYEGGMAAGGCSSCAYDPLGNALATTDPRGFTTIFERNEMGDVFRTNASRPYEYKVETIYDANRNVTREDTEDVGVQFDSDDPGSAG